MNREERAKQFLSFDALSGLREELKQREEKMLRVEKKEVTEEQAIEISNCLTILEKGDNIKVMFFYKGLYVEVMGEVTCKNLAYKYLVVNGNKILFDDIYKLSIGPFN